MRARCALPAMRTDVTVGPGSIEVVTSQGPSQSGSTYPISVR
jgi:hypothetical protein